VSRVCKKRQDKVTIDFLKTMYTLQHNEYYADKPER
jgi:hypothetical protein